jgi:hypothetical protein
MKHLKTFNENQSANQHNQNYRELVDILQSEVLDDYDIYKGDYLMERGDASGNYTNEPCYLFHNPTGGFIYHMVIYPKNRLTKEGKEIVKKLSKDIEFLKDRISDFLGIEFEVKDHTTSLVIIIKDSFYEECI